MLTTRITRKEHFFLKSIFHLFKLRGIAPIAFDKSSYPQQPLFLPSKIGALYNVLFACYILVVYILTFPFYYHESAEKLESERLIDVMHTGIGSLTAVVILVIFCFRQSTTAEIANRIYSISEQCAILTDQRFNGIRALWRSAKTVLLVNVVLWFSLFCTMNRSSAIYSLTLQLCNFVSNALLIQYTIVVKMIEELYNAGNDSLVQTMKNYTQLADVTMRRDGLRIKVIDKLSRVQKLHWELSKLCQDVSKFYSQPMLLGALNIFMLLVLGGYYVAKPLFLGHNRLPAITYAHTVLYLIMFIVSLTVFARSITNTVEKSSMTEDLVNDYLYLKICKDPRVTMQLKNFSHYLARKNVQFTVFGLFSLDESMLMAISGAITTHLIILLQFQKGNVH